MKIAVAQINTRVGDFAATSQRMLEIARSVQAQGAGLLVFGVPVLTGPDPGSLSESEEFFLDLTETITSLARELPLPTIVPIVMSMGRESIYEAILIRDGHAWPLRLMSWHGVSGAYSAFSDDLHFQLDGMDFGIAFDVHTLDRFAHGRVRADCIIYLPMYCLNTNDEISVLAPSISDGCFVGEAAGADAWIVAAGAVGGYDEQIFTGGSFVMSPWGELAWVAPSFEESVGIAQVDPLFEGPLENSVSAGMYQRIPHLWNGLVLGVRDFFNKDEATHASVLLTQGLESFACAVLLVDALGPTRVHAFISPDADEVARADMAELVRNLRIDAYDLAAGHEALFQAAAQDSAVDSSAFAASLFAQISRERSWLCVSPQDKTGFALEARSGAVPYAVLAPFGDVYRTDLLALLRHRNTVSPVIPAPALRRLHVPDIADGGAARESGRYNSDESFLNAVDAVLLLHIERTLGLSGIAAQQGTPALVESVLSTLASQVMYRRAMPSIPVVSDRTLAEHDWPIGLAWKDKLRPYSSEHFEGAGGYAERLFAQLVGNLPIDEDFDPQSQINDVMGLLSELGDAPMQGDGSQNSDSFDLGLFSDN